ncbi:hypothetical protein 162322560 [Organic Lake phycodnavirus 1]|jgi:single-stranded DNA-specific DHH superfamily exonuclease|nr:hypothetical protein 162322560 [Organic Lake phycodnavirus 1]
MNELKSDCKEYNALNYRTLIHTGSTLHTTNVVTTEESLANFLNDDMDKNRKGIWSKLTKTAKIVKIKKYIKDIRESYNLTQDEVNKTTNLLTKMIERKKLSKNNELVYNQDSGHIESIPGLTFNKTSRVFSLLTDKPSTLKVKKTIPKID